MNKVSILFNRNHACAIRTFINFNNLGKYAFFCTGGNKGEQASDEKKKTKPLPKITLIDQEKMSVITLEQARKIAEKRNLKLINVVDFDTKSSRPIYKLMTSHDYHAEELKRRQEKKEAKNNQIKAEKLLSISSKISEHDLKNNINKCLKWITKMHEVRVVVSADDGDMQKAEKVVTAIEKDMKSVEGRILQKRNKGNEVRFTIMPTIKKETAKGSTENDKKFLEPNNLNVQQVRSAHFI